MKCEINNFLHNSQITVQTVYGSKWVCAGQLAGSLNFQHTMTASQAREMAAALIACADAQEATVNAELAAHRESLAVAA